MPLNIPRNLLSVEILCIPKKTGLEFTVKITGKELMKNTSQNYLINILKCRVHT